VDGLGVHGLGSGNNPARAGQEIPALDGHGFPPKEKRRREKRRLCSGTD
jgi:hypothetical protein